MARPEKFDDLPDYQRAPHEFARIDLQHLTVDVAVGAAVLALVDIARKSSAFEVTEDGVFTIAVPLTEEEVERKLTAAQRSWDLGRDDYEAAVRGDRQIEAWRRYGVDQWAKGEDHAPIDWASLDETAEVSA